MKGMSVISNVILCLFHHEATQAGFKNSSCFLTDLEQTRNWLEGGKLVALKTKVNPSHKCLIMPWIARV